jgi:hypothetical protein
MASATGAALASVAAGDGGSIEHAAGRAQRTSIATAEPIAAKGCFEARMVIEPAHDPMRRDHNASALVSIPARDSAALDVEAQRTRGSSSSSSSSLL